MATRTLIGVVLGVFLVGCGGDLTDGGGDGTGDPNDPNDPGDPGAIAACKRVDLVIAVDDSGSMQEEKDAMRNDVFPAFASELLTIGGGLEDYRIGVIDACPTPASFHTAGQAGECSFSSGKPWMESSSPDLVGEFQCVGDIVSADSACSGQNDDEQPASAAAAALEPPMTSGANQGFVRDDALLVVIAITDEDEQPTPGASAGEVYDRLVALKGGDVNKMVFLGIGGSSNCDGVYGTAEAADKLQAVSRRFEDVDQGLFWDLCQGQLEDGLAAAMDVIESACDDFCNDPDGCDGGDGTPPDDDETPPVL
ncbi:MAG TPA: hypothetical protein VML75_01570 [Kofleriaceae bacterium]|nr:hypothetical protein [Kofleriaceae bacterium]